MQTRKPLLYTRSLSTSKPPSSCTLANVRNIQVHTEYETFANLERSLSVQGPKSPAVQKHIRQQQYDHLTAALTALDSVSFLTTSSLLLVQALITGVSHSHPILSGS